MKTVELNEANKPLREYAEEARDAPIVVTEAGKASAAIVPVEQGDLETLSLSTNEAFQQVIERSRARQRAEGGLSAEQLRGRLGL